MARERSPGLPEDVGGGVGGEVVELRDHGPGHRVLGVGEGGQLGAVNIGVLILHTPSVSWE